MDILRLSFKHDPKQASKIMSQIYKDDQKISNIVKKLVHISKNKWLRVYLFLLLKFLQTIMEVCQKQKINLYSKKMELMLLKFRAIHLLP